MSSRLQDDVVYDDNTVVCGYIKHFAQGTNDINIPIEVIDIIYDYYLHWKWDKNSNKDNHLIISKYGMNVTEKPEHYIDGLTFSTIFIDNWIDKDGRYYFKFKLYGTVSPASDEIAIGIITKDYDIGDRLGIGSDTNGWSWYIWSVNHSATYFVSFKKMLSYGLGDKDECIFDIIIDDKSCIVNFYYQTFDGKKETVIIDTIRAPIKIGVSINSKTNPLSLEIIEQQRPFKCYM